MVIRSALSQYGEILSLQDEAWAKHYRYTVSNGVRIAMMTFKKHIPSHISIAGYRALTSYHGQPQTCYGCGDTDHMYHICPKRREARSTTAPSDPTWANIVASFPSNTDVPDTVDVTTMDITPLPLTVRELTPSETRKEREPPVPASIHDSQRLHDTKPSPVSTPTTHDDENPSQHQWTDEDPELQRNLIGGKPPTENTLASTTEWPLLPSLNAEHRDAPSSNPPDAPPTTNADGTPAHNDIVTAPLTEHMTVGGHRPGTNRKKKLQTEKPGESSQDKKETGFGQWCHHRKY
jgi:hypothetical protein